MKKMLEEMIKLNEAKHRLKQKWWVVVVTIAAREVEAIGLQNLALNGNSIQAIEHQRVGLKTWTS
jgi:hypothetical protein